MKKIIFILTVAIILISCGNSNNAPSKADLFPKAKKYLDGKLNTQPNEYYIEFNSLDTIAPVSSRKIEKLKMNRLHKEFDIEYNAMQQLLDIDKRFGSKRSKETINQIERASFIKDSISRWKSRAEELSNTDTLAFSAKITGVGTDVATGAKKKGMEMIVLFDLEYDVDLELNNLLYGN